MTTALINLLFMFSPPADFAPPYAFDPVTAEVSIDEDGALEVLAYDSAGRMDGALLATPLPDYVQIDASFGDGYVSFELVPNDDGAGIRNVSMDLDELVAEHRISTMLNFASVIEGPEQPITKRRCMIQFAAIATLCPGAAALGIGAAAVIPCALGLGKTWCDCLPLLGYDPCN